MSKSCKIEDTTMTKLQKIKVLYAEKYKRVITISDIVELLLSEDVIINNLKKHINK